MRIQYWSDIISFLTLLALLGLAPLLFDLYLKLGWGS